MGDRIAVINGGALHSLMFREQQPGGTFLVREASDAIVRRYEDRCEQTVTSPRSGKRVTWRRLMREQADAYAAHLHGKTAYRPFVIDH